MTHPMLKKGICPIARQSGLDSDRDRVPNIIDCKPYDSNRQGWIHDVGQNVKERYNRYRVIKDVDERRKRAREGAARAVIRDEQDKQAIANARYRTQLQGRQERQKIKASYSNKSSGGVGGFVSSLVGSASGYSGIGGGSSGGGLGGLSISQSSGYFGGSSSSPRRTKHRRHHHKTKRS